MYRSMKEFKKDWTAALRSGEYRKGKGRLCKPGKEHDKFCCLGVAADLLIRAGHKIEWVEDRDVYGVDHALKGRGNTATTGFLEDTIPVFLRKWLDEWTSCTGRREGTLASLNDKGESFKFIAKQIEEWE